MTPSTVDLAPLFVVQIAVTAAVITAYGLSVISRFRALEYEGAGRLTMLAAFVLGNRSSPALPEALVTRAGQTLPESQFLNTGARFVAWVRRFREDGTLPDRTDAEPHRIDTAVGRLLLPVITTVGAPLYALLGLAVYLVESRRSRFEVASSTELRRFELSTAAVTFAFSTGYVALSAFVASSWWRGLSVAIALAGAAASLGQAALLIRAQVQAKAFWQNELIHIMAIAAQKDNHDLFNRAHLLSTDIRSEPDVPIPGTLGAYVGIFAAVQSLLALLADQVAWL